MFSWDKKFFKISFFSIIVLELLSFFFFLFPHWANLFFILFLFLVAFFSLKNFTYGIYFVLAELIIGSKGYLFYADIEGKKISLRLGLFLVVGGIWLAKNIIIFFKKKKIYIPFLHSSLFFPYLLLIAFVLFGGVNGIVNHNDFKNIFLDINGWLFFAMAFPFYDGIKKENILQLNGVILGSILALIFETVILFFIFSHNFFLFLSSVYYWTRATGIAEIVKINNGFYRVFFQSHIYVLLAFIFVLPFLNKHFVQERKPLKRNFFMLGLTSSLLLVIIISLSRSFWLGGLSAYLLFLFYLGYRFSLKAVLDNLLLMFFIGVITLGMLGILIKIPLGKNNMNISRVSSLFSERVLADRKEVAIGSRWNLLFPLAEKTKRSWFLGEGFGATVTYKTEDPRALINNPDGWYTTYAFEWGYLDIWLKLGLAGLLAYFFYLGRILKLLWKKKDNFYFLGGVFAFSALLVIHFFTPYLNHPLGISFLLWLGAIYDKIK